MIKAIILFVILASFVALAYILNKKTPIPEGCENLNAECDGCKIISCVHHPSKGEKKC